jgi:hypothetical protein
MNARCDVAATAHARLPRDERRLDSGRIAYWFLDAYDETGAEMGEGTA